jgi:hypothetical protein
MGFPSFYNSVAECVSVSGRIDWEDLLKDYGEYLYPGIGFSDSCLSATSPMGCLLRSGPNENDHDKIWKLQNAAIQRCSELEEGSQEAVVLELMFKYLRCLNDYSAIFDNKEMRYDRNNLEFTIGRLMHEDLVALLNEIEQPQRFKKFFQEESNVISKFIENTDWITIHTAPQKQAIQSELQSIQGEITNLQNQIDRNRAKLSENWKYWLIWGLCPVTVALIVAVALSPTVNGFVSLIVLIFAGVIYLGGPVVALWLIVLIFSSAISALENSNLSSKLPSLRYKLSQLVKKLSLLAKNGP